MRASIAIATEPLALSLPSLRRSSRMVQRSLTVYKHTWAVIVSGFFEPVFYLFGVGIGLGALVPDIDGVRYPAYVMPGLLAWSCFNGALADGMFNIFFKLRFQKIYDSILATPMRVPDIAFGEMLWTITRSSLYAAAFLVVTLATGWITGEPLLLSGWAVLALPAAIFASAAFAAIAVCATGFIRKVQDFDVVMGLAVMPMFLFSGVFFPMAQLPEAVQWMVGALPLYHAVELLRQLTTGTVTLGVLLHVGYLALLGGAAFLVAIRRLERTLVK